MAEEKPKTETPAAKSASGKMLVKLASAGRDDKFLVPQDGGGEPFVVTVQGVEVPANAVDALLEIATANSVALVVTEVEQEAKK